MRTLALVSTSLAGLCLIGWGVAPDSTLANDLNDGISSYTDEPIRALDQLGDPEINFTFIELRAKSKVSAIIPPRLVSPQFDVPAPPGVSVSPPSGGYMGNINSVVLQPGSSVYGDIVIIDQSTAEKTQIILGSKSYTSGLGTDFDIQGALDNVDKLEEYSEAAAAASGASGASGRVGVVEGSFPELPTPAIP